MLYLSYDVVLDVFQCLNNETLQKVRQAFQELDWMEESEKRRSARKIVPFLKKHLPTDDRERALNRGLMKLFNQINEDSTWHIDITRWIKASDPFFVESRQYTKVSDRWHEVFVNHHVKRFVPISIENFKRDILHAKRWIDYISVKSRCEKNNKVRIDIVYLPDAFQDI